MASGAGMPLISSRIAHPSSVKITRRQLLPHFSFAAGFLHIANAVGSQNQLHLSIEAIKETIQQDIQKGQYYVTGDLTKNIYSKDCRFIDPTTNVKGVDNYVAAIKALFDPSSSKHELLSIQVTSPNTIQAKWRLEGHLKFPWRPHIEPYSGTTTYTVNDDGLVVGHEETWDISLLTAFLEFLTPSFPKSDMESK